MADPDTSTVSRISPARDRVDEVVSTPGPATHLTTASHRLWATDGTDASPWSHRWPHLCG